MNIQIKNATNITADDYICVAGTCYNSFSGSGTVTSVSTDDVYLTGGPLWKKEDTPKLVKEIIDIKDDEKVIDTKEPIIETVFTSVKDKYDLTDVKKLVVINGSGTCHVWGNSTGKINGN